MFSILTTEEKKELFKIVLLMIVATALELFGFVAIYPLIKYVVAGEDDKNYLYDLPVYLYSGGLLLVYFTRFLYLNYFSKIVSNYVYKISTRVSTNMFENYLHKNINFFKKNNTSFLIKSTVSDVHLLSGLVYSLLILFTEFFIIATILIALIFIDPLFTLSIFILFTFFITIHYKVNQYKLKEIGNIKHKSDSLRLKFIQETFLSIKYFKIYNALNYAANRYKIKTIESGCANSYLMHKQMSPKLWLEWFFYSLIVICIYLLYERSNDIRSFSPLFAMFGIAAARILPSINKIINGWQNINSNHSIITTVNNNLKNHNYSGINHKKLSKVNSIDIINLDFSHDGTPLFNSLNLNFSAGDIIGITGQSGSGKSTLLDLILGFYQPDNGKILVNNCSSVFHNTGYYERIGYVGQDIAILDDSLINNIAYGLENFNYDKLTQVISDVNLTDYLNKLPNGLNTILGEHGSIMSGGQKQRLSIARALYKNPDVLILDEFTSALDFENEKIILNVLKKYRKDSIIIIVSHNYKCFDICNKLINIDELRG